MTLMMKGKPAMIMNEKVLQSELIKLEIKIEKMEQKKENYCFRSSYEFDKHLDRLHIYKQFENVLRKMIQQNEESRKIVRS